MAQTCQECNSKEKTQQLCAEWAAAKNRAAGFYTTPRPDKKRIIIREGLRYERKLQYILHTGKAISGNAPWRDVRRLHALLLAGDLLSVLLV